VVAADRLTVARTSQCTEAGWSVGGPSTTARRSTHVATYRMVYGDDEQVVRETFENIDDLQREDGRVVLFRGKEAILRVQEQHLQALEELGG
jgi:hypothetical protein